MISILLPLIVGVSISIAASLLGSFAILKRMALVGDALSHVALPGLGLAIFFKVNPFLGAAVFLLAAILGIWFLEYKSSLSVETIVGVFFTASLAVGALLLSEQELLESLFGDISNLTLADAVASVVLALFLIIMLLLLHRKLALHMLSQELASSVGINSRQIELVYLLLFALGVALGIKFVGALLMGALIIIPAAAAKNISRGLHQFMAISVVFGIASSVLGVYLSAAYHFPPGPVFILSSTAIFLLTLFWKKSFK